MTGLSLDAISFSYPKQAVLDKVSCRFDQGKFHVILGPNGSGKTTLLDILSGFSKPDSGCAYLGSTPLINLSKRDIARQISLVSQDYNIRFPFTVEEVVLMGRHPFIDRFSRPTKEDFSLVEEVMHHTGINHLKHKKMTEISGGEKQRSVFARALCQNTPFLLLDEAFANMDIRHTLELLKLLKEYVRRKNKTVIAVLHDLNMAAQWADTALMIKAGRVLIHGDIDTVFTDTNIQAIFDVEPRVAFNEYTRSKQVFFLA